MSELDLLQKSLPEGSTNIERYNEEELHFDFNGLHFLVLANNYNNWLQITTYRGHTKALNGFTQSLLQFIHAA